MGSASAFVKGRRRDQVGTGSAFGGAQSASLSARHREHRRRDPRRDHRRACRAAIAWSCGVSAPSRPNSARPAPGAIRAPATRCRSRRNSCRSSRPARKCASGSTNKRRVGVHAHLSSAWTPTLRQSIERADRKIVDLLALALGLLRHGRDRLHRLDGRRFVFFHGRLLRLRRWRGGVGRRRRLDGVGRRHGFRRLDGRLFRRAWRDGRYGGRRGR